jgi:ACR3 family arsenite transporter
VSGPAPEERAVLARLSLLDRFLPLWILLAMAGGLLLGRFFPAIQGVLDAVRIGNTSLPIALGLLLMMYPVLAKVHYEELGRVARDRRLLRLSLLLVWGLGPALMFALAWLFLPTQPEFRTGLILIGLAPCIAMVLIWIDLAQGDREAAALLVAINSIVQVLAYALLGGFYLKILPGWLGLATQDVAFSMAEIARAVLVFLGLPLAAGFLTRRIGLHLKGPRWYEQRFIPFISPFALYGLLFTIVVMFALGAVAALFRDNVVHGLRGGPAQRAQLRENSDACLHRRRQQLRAGHRCEHQRLGGQFPPGVGRGDRPADRSAGAGGAGVRVPLAQAPLPGQHESHRHHHSLTR